MATERQSPDAILELDNLSGTVSEIQDDPDSPDSNWLDASSNNSDSAVRVSFPTPTGPPTVGTDLQEFRALVRKYGGTGIPTARVELYEDGSLVRAGSDIDITTDTVLSFKWNANEISTSDGSLVECRVYGTKAGGAPSVRATVEVGAIEWNVTYDSGQVKTASATLSGVGSLAGLARAIRAATATMSGIGTLSAAVGVIRPASVILSGTGALSAKGSYLQLASATLSGTGFLAAQGGVYKMAAASLSGAGSLAASAFVTRAATAALSGTGALAAAAVVIRLASVTFSGTGMLTAVGTVIEGAICGSATLSGTGALSVKAVYIVIAKVTLSGEGILSVSAILYGGLSPTLLVAQKSPHRLPYVEAKVYDYEQGIKRLTWTRLYEGSEPDNHHGIAFDGQGSMHRIRSAANNKLYRQKISSPGPSSDYSSWMQIATDCAGPCAIAAQGAKVYIFYKTTGNILWKYYSHNYGQDWSNAQLVSYADVLSLAAAWWGTGDIVVCFALKSDELNGIVLDSSDQSTSQHVKEFHGAATHIFLDTYGIGATFNASTPAIEIVLAAKESDTPYNHYDLWRTRFSNTYHFLALESFLMSPEGEDLTYEYPDCHLPASHQDYETTRIITAEKYIGTTAFTRPLNCHMVRGTYWSDSTFTEPKPFIDISSTYGLRISSDDDYWWIERPDGVWRAPRPAASALELTQDIVSLQQNAIARPDSSGRGNLIIELNNSKGRYNAGEGLVPSLINNRSEVVLKLGYKTTAGNEAVDAGTYWVDSWEYSSKPNQSLFTIYCLDGWGLMDHWSARYQMRWNKDEINPKSVWQILYQVLARAGIKLTNTPPKPQSTAINNFYPDFTVNPGTGGDSVILSLLSFVPDKLVFRGQEAFTKNPLADEESCYSYGTDHAILAGRYSQQVTLSRSRSLGRSAAGARILEEAHDWDLLQLAIDILDQDYDPNLQTTTRAQERADAILRQASLSAYAASLVVSTNVGQELLDVVDVIDERCGISEQKYRVQSIRTDYDRRKGQYEQLLTIGAP
jgi:hypothetical protein